MNRSLSLFPPFLHVYSENSSRLQTEGEGSNHHRRPKRHQREHPRLFTRHDAKIIMADIQNDKGWQVCNYISANGGIASYIRCDISNKANVQAAVETAVKSHGWLNVMVNNAGTITRYRPFPDIETCDVQKVLAVNVMGVFLGIKHATRAMISADRGNIINTTSGASVMAGMTVAHYTTSKHAVVGLTKDAAVDLGRRGVRVNCVSPHLVASLLTLWALGMDAKPEDIAKAVLFLASEECRYVNGRNLVVDEGYTMRRCVEREKEKFWRKWSWR